MKNFLTAAGIALVATAPLCAGELSPESLAKIVKIVAGGAGTPGKVACSNAALKAELAKIGVASDPSCRVAWASSLNEVKSLKAAGKFVMCGKVEWLTAGGAVAMVEEGGKSAIYLHMGNIAASKVALSDAVLKIGKKL